LLSHTYVGKTIPRIEGPDKVMGRARFVADVDLPGLVWGKVLRSPVAHARIVSVDVSPALALPGVRAAITGADVAGVRTGRNIQDMPVLCSDVVRFIGDRVAAIAADSPEVADEALGLIEVVYDELPVVTDPQLAMGDDAPVLHPDFRSYRGAPDIPDIRNLQARTLFGKGDPEVGFADADRVFEHTFRIERVHQAYLEPRACIAQVEEDGTARIWSSCKVPYHLRDLLAEMLGLPENKVVVTPCKIGGDFGGKGAVGSEPIAYWLAKRCSRPVKIVQSYAEEFQAGNPRHPATVTLRTGVKNDGTLTARDVRIVFDGGAYAANRAAPGIGLPSVVRAPGPYRIPHARIESLWVYTNSVPGGIMRAPGQPQIMFASESQMDLIAQELGLDPLELRLRNILEEGDLWPNGDKFEGVNGRLTLEAVREASDWGMPLPPNRGRGIAISERGIGSGECGLTLRMGADGSLIAISGIPDVGTGAFTILRAVLADQLQVPFESLEVVAGDTNEALPDAGIGGSKHTYSLNESASAATDELRSRLAALAADRLECSIDDLELVDGAFRVRGHPATGLPLLQLGAEAAAANGGAIEVQASGPKGRARQTCFVAYVVEVEVDPETGQISPLKLSAAYDAGFVMNPQLIEAQIDGGTIQGLGFALMEELRVDAGGRTSAANFGDYKIPTWLDVPPLDNVFVEGASGPGPFGAKAVGELGVLVLAPALASAVQQAVGVRIPQTPITAEKVHNSLKSQVPSLRSDHRTLET
jgi:CO/xanthine dehydrogenase Mo-binding subunit